VTGRVLVIPAAGRGSRLKSVSPKPLVAVAGRPMLDHLFDLYHAWVDDFIVVVNPEAEAAIRAHSAARGERVAFAVQEAPTGMLDAILLAADSVRVTGAQHVWITWADQIAVRSETVAALARAGGEAGVAMALPTLQRRNPYTHLERDATGRIVRVRYRRENDPMPATGESEMGVFALSRAAYLDDLSRFSMELGGAGGAATGERNFLPFIPWLASRASVVTFSALEDVEAVGVNTPEDLRLVEAALVSRR
jgi:bifunctional N-acetylglucosamine-1-phosphate-uridyltransferase/glucosamine-1-phosphate-acetyltransferase GlmU-like protein